MKQIFFALSIVTVVLSACQPKMKAPEGDFSIHADIEGVDTIIFEKIEANTLLLIDTLYAVDGEFVVANTLEGEAFFLLRTPEGEGINLLIKKGEHIEIEGQKTNWSDNYTVQGSVGSLLIQELNDRLASFEIAIDGIYEEAKVAQKEDFESLQDRFNENFEEHRTYLRNYIDEHIDSPTAILALFQAVKGENVLNLYADFEVYEKVNNAFKKNLPNSSHTQLLSEIVDMAFAKDFTLKDVNDKDISLSDFQGDLVLLDFWASWCRPCRAINPAMVKLYEKYHQAGLEIIGISLDGTPQQPNAKSDWMKAIKEDGITWPQVSDLKGWKTSVREKYAFRSIPHTVLIAKDGRIIGENLPHELLEEKIAEVLNR